MTPECGHRVDWTELNGYIDPLDMLIYSLPKILCSLSITSRNYLCCHPGGSSVTHTESDGYPIRHYQRPVLIGIGSRVRLRQKLGDLGPGFFSNP